MSERSFLSRLPKSFPEARPLDSPDPWFQVFALDKDVLAIFEPRHYEEVFSFLVLGQDKALLLDTGMGIANIKPVAESLTDLPIIVVNSHTHYDHIGDNHRFDTIYASGSDFARQRLARGYSTQEMMRHWEPELLFAPLPENFDPATFSIPPSPHTPIAEGDSFDLGGRELLVLETPGHSPDSIMLLDEANRILLTGDTYYPDELYGHLPGSDLAVYLQTMQRLSTMTPRFDWLYCSHVVPVRPPGDLADTARVLGEILGGRQPDEHPKPGFVRFNEPFFHVLVREDQLPSQP